VIVALAGARIDGVDALYRVLTEMPVGERWPLVVVRRTERVELNVTPERKS
jgi:S1-C subfamily serine protease